MNYKVHAPATKFGQERLMSVLMAPQSQRRRHRLCSCAISTRLVRDASRFEAPPWSHV
jgi:hypothetical protein